MKHFKFRPRKDQVHFWKIALNRSLATSKARLRSIYADSLGRAAQLEEKAKRLDTAIGAAMDRAANVADLHYRGWDVWRHDPKLLHKVVDRMDKDSAPLRERQAGYLEQARILRARYLEDVAALDATHEQLLKEADQVCRCQKP
jgi:hypothetical protein